MDMKVFFGQSIYTMKRFKHVEKNSNTQRTYLLLKSINDPFLRLTTEFVDYIMYLIYQQACTDILSYLRQQSTVRKYIYVFLVSHLF